ncbi:MAG TPA: HD domain-containing protein [Bacillota bacterium]|nr:HD domain-containing protein [Bacillota bacterium]
MFKINLARLVLKEEVSSLVEEIEKLTKASVLIQDANRRAIKGEVPKEPAGKYPVMLNGKIIGWVCGSRNASVIASYLSQLAALEVQKRSLGRETLEKYKELTLLYDLSEKLSERLSPGEVAQLVIDETRKIIKGDDISVTLVNEETGLLDIFTAGGREPDPAADLGPLGFFVENVINTGKAEIVNDVLSDPRYGSSGGNINSLICSPLKVKDRVVGAINIASKKPVSYSAEDLKLLSALAFQAAADIENARLYNSLKETFLTTVLTLAETIEKRDPYTWGHTQRVTNYSAAIGKTLGLSKLEIERLALAAMLHDIGKIGIRDSILLKKGKLTTEEFEEVKMHTIYAEEILEHIKHFKDIVPAVKHHHERYDGTGYPERLRGENINVMARIISIADAFDAMTTDRPYRKRLLLDSALYELKNNAGTQFDPVMVEAFFSAYDSRNILPKVD